MKDLTELVCILDRSGSMAGLESDTIGGFNAMIKKQQTEEGAAYVSTVLFDHASEILHERQSQVLCKPPGWCRIEAPHRRITIWPERIVPRKKMPVERRSESCCRWQTSAAWMTSRICLRRPLPSSWRMAWDSV